MKKKKIVIPILCLLVFIVAILFWYQHEKNENRMYVPANSYNFLLTVTLEKESKKQFMEKYMKDSWKIRNDYDLGGNKVELKFELPYDIEAYKITKEELSKEIYVLDIK